MAILILIIGIILFIGLIVIHEFGHFIVARRNGVVAEEFGIFFGPAIYTRKTKGGWVFKLNTIPLGGYVKLKGEHDSDVEPGSYGAASLWVKTKIMSAGVFSNLVTGLVLLVILCLIGLPQIIPNQFSAGHSHTIQKATTVVEIGSVLQNSPASRAGLKDNDDITAIGPKNNVQKVTSVSSLQSITKEFAGKSVLVDFTRNNKQLQSSTVLNTNAQASSGQQKIYLGVGIGTYSSGVTLIRYTWTAPIVALGLTKQIIVLSYQGLAHAIHGLGGIIAGTATHNTAARKNAQSTASAQVVGPVGIFVILKDGSAVGIQFMLFIIALISLTLAIMNILPIPALDGGRLWLTLITRGIRHPMSAGAEEMVNAVGMLVLILLVGLITYVDIRRFF
ncbi:MAG TPA: M50 family metallopeptidase [Candidatus Saccharimonadales bacterium]|jgi:regulator of sigma E protease